jgi:hypothetical protein
LVVAASEDPDPVLSPEPELLFPFGFEDPEEDDEEPDE